MTSDDLIARLQTMADLGKAAFFPRFFKTGPGQYGEGDVFIGVTVPQIRSVVKEFRAMPLSQVPDLLRSPLHEARLAGLLLMALKFSKADETEREKIVRLYLKNLTYVNNWDLVDSSAPYILGEWLMDKDRSVLDTYARSGDLWEERIAIVATLAFIRKGQLEDTVRIAEILLHHPHDLIHKAVGWMLREAGKRDLSVLRKFLDTHAAVMPRTMLRYALEKLPEPERKRYMAMKKRS